MSVTNVSTLLLDIPMDLERIDLIIIKFRIRGIHYQLEMHENYAVIIGILGGFVIRLVIRILRLIFKNIKKILKKNLDNRSRQLNEIRGGDQQFSIDKCFDTEELYQITDGKLSNIIRRILKSPISGTLIVSGQLAIFTYIINNIFGPTFHLARAGVQVSIPYKAKILAKFVVSAMFTPILTKLLINFSLTSGLPILIVIALSSSLLLAPINCEKVIIPPPHSSNLNLSKIRYIDIPEVKKLILMQNLSKTDRIMVPNEMISNQSLTEEILQKPPFVRSSLFFSKSEKKVQRFCSKTRSFKPLSQRTKTLADLRQEDGLNGHAEAENSTNNYEQNKKKLKEIKIKDIDSTDFL